MNARRHDLDYVQPPQCPRCGAAMNADVLRVPAPRAISRVGAPVAPRPVLATWRCGQCGCFQPRMAA